MILKHSLSITITNVQLVFKILIYAFIVFFIGSAVCVTLLEPVLNSIGQSLDLVEIVEHFSRDIFEGDGAVFERIISSVEHYALLHPDELTKILVLMLLLFVAGKYFFALIICPVAYVLNHKMATNFVEGFFHSIVSVGFKGLGTASLYTLISTPIDVGILAGAFFLGKWLSLGIGLFGMIFAIIVGILLITLRLSIMGQWIAVFVNEKVKFGLQIKRGFMLGFKNFPKVFPAMLTLSIVIYGVVATTMIPTFMIIPIVTVPVGIVMFSAIHLVMYYRFNDRSYYNE